MVVQSGIDRLWQSLLCDDEGNRNVVLHVNIRRAYQPAQRGLGIMYYLQGYLILVNCGIRERKRAACVRLRTYLDCL